MKKGIFLLLLCVFSAVNATEPGNFVSNARWVSAVFAGKGKVSFRKDKDLYTQKHDCADGNTNWHTLDLDLAPGTYVFRVSVRTEGTASGGGAVPAVQLLGSKKLVTGKPVVTGGKWDSAEVNFTLTAKDTKIRLWVTQSKFPGRVQFRNPVIEKQTKRSADAIQKEEFPKSGNFAAGARWVSAVFAGKGKVSFGKAKDLYTQKHDCADGNTNWHTLDLDLAPGTYVFRVSVRTEGTASGGGAVPAVQLLGSKKLVTGKPVVTGGKWDSAEVNFILTAKDPKIRLWVTQTKFTGQIQFRNPVIEKQTRRSPYVILNKVFPEPRECRLGCEPGRVYRVTLKNLKSVPLCFLDQDRKPIAKLNCRDGECFTAPDGLMLTTLKVTGPNASVRIEEQPEAPSAFNWNFWNSWHMVGPLSGGTAWRDFELKTTPEYAVGRFFMSAEIMVNGNRIGHGLRAYTDEYYFNLKPYLKTGMNRIEFRFPAKKKALREILAADIEFRFADGSRQILLTSGGSWKYRDPDGSEHDVTDFRPSWYNRGLFDKSWIVPAALPARLFEPFPAEVKLALNTSQVKAGEPLNGKLMVKFNAMPWFQSSRLALRIMDKSGKMVWRQWLFSDRDLTTLKKGDVVELPFRLFTEYLREGHYSIYADERLAAGKLGSFSLKGMISLSREIPKMIRQGGMDCFLQGAFTVADAIYLGSPCYNARYGRNIEDDYRNFADAGFKVFSLVCYFGHDTVKNGSQGRAGIWQGIGKYDFSQIDAYAEKLLSSVPDARIILHFSCHMPEWWLKQFPEEAVVWDDGTRTRFVSLASEKFRKDLKTALSETFRYISSKPWSRRILAFYAVSGYDGQWFQPMDYGPKQRFADYSVHMQKEFRSWLRKQYGNDVSALRKAWNDPAVSFETAMIPTRAERIGKNYYFDPAASRNVLDFAHCTAQQTEDVIGLIAATVKKELGGILFGTYYIPGDTTYRNAQAQRPCTDGIYDNHEFDFAASPLGYDCHGLDQKGTGSSFAVNQTMRLNNVFYVGEDDSRTYLSMVKNPRWGNPDTFGTLAGLRRNMAKRLALGHGFWHYDMWGHWYSSPAIREHLRREIILMNELRRWKPLQELNAEAISVVKVGTSLHKRMNTPADLHQVHFPRVKSIPPLFIRDSVLLRDLNNPRLPQYKLYIFGDCFALNAADRKKIDSVKKNGAVLLFTHAAGYSDWNKLSAENISSLTGIRIEEAEPGQDLSPMNWTIPVDSKVFPTLKGTLVDPPKAKRFRVNDPEAEIIGYYADDKTPAAAIKKHKDWTAVYLPNAFPSNLLMNEIGRYLKLHVYTDLPVIAMAGGRVVSVYCPVEQVEGQLYLPAEFAAYEVFTGKFHKPGKTLPLKMAFGETRLFFLGTEAEVREFSRIQQQLQIGFEK